VRRVPLRAEKRRDRRGDRREGGEGLSAAIRAALAGSHSSAMAAALTSAKPMPPVRRRVLRKPMAALSARRAGAHTTPPTPVPLRMMPMARPRRASNQPGAMVTAGM